MLSEKNVAHFRPQRILLPIDFSPSSPAALETGREMAKRYDAEIILLTVVPMFSASKVSDEFIPTLSPDSVRSKDRDDLSQVVAEMVAQGIKASSMTEIGEDVVKNILLTIEKENIDLVIISTHGETGWHEAIFGSIAQKVVEQVNVSLLLLRSSKAVAKKVDHLHDRALLEDPLVPVEAAH